LYESRSFIGAGFLEAVYEEALEKEFHIQIPFKPSKVAVVFDNQLMKKHYRADFVCYESIIIEIKVCRKIPVILYSQLTNYFVYKMELGILINFGMPSLFYKRIINMN
jgi:GxxExxY protein